MKSIGHCVGRWGTGMTETCLWNRTLKMLDNQVSDTLASDVEQPIQLLRSEVWMEAGRGQFELQSEFTALKWEGG